MSVSIQRILQDRRQYGVRLPVTRDFAQQTYADRFTLSRMTLHKALQGHNGCVNSLYWSRGGDKLLSGSDDTSLIMWLPFEDYKSKYKIETGHRDNIFSAKFMPNTSDKVVVSAGGDSEVRVFDVDDATGLSTQAPRHVYTCHSGSVKRIALLGDSPFEYLTCSEDCTVRHFDLRKPHHCSPRFFRQRNAGSEEAKNDCSTPLVDYSKNSIELHTLSVNAIYPHYFAVGGANDLIYLHDRRMAVRQYTGNITPTQPVRSFTCALDRRRRNKHVTACKFSDYNGRELIGSWSSDGVYLFDINDSPLESIRLSTVQQDSQPRPTHEHPSPPRQDSTQAAMVNIIRHFREAQLNDVLDLLDDFLADHAYRHTPQSVSREEAEGSRENRKCLYIWGLCLCAATHMRRVSELDYGEHNGSYFRGEEQSTAQIKMFQAESVMPSAWQGLWCLAVGFWVAAGGRHPDTNQYRRSWLRKSRSYGMRAREAFLSHVDRDDPDPSDKDERTIKLMEDFTRDVFLALENESPSQESSDEEDRWYWLDNMYMVPRKVTDQDTSEEHKRRDVSSTSSTRQSPTKRARHAISEHEEDNSYSDSDDVSESTDDSMDDSEDNSEDEDEDEDESMDDGEGMGRWQRRMSDETSSSNSSSNSRGVSSPSHSSDSDRSSLNVWYLHLGSDGGGLHGDGEMILGLDDDKYDPLGVGRDTDMVGYRSKFTGHCNLRTVKDVNFFGLRDEYIVSGSDDGLTFVWDKTTGQIVQVLKADEDTVNVVQGHPTYPIMAVSGIDDTVKIFTPTSRLAATSAIRDPTLDTSYAPSSRLFELDSIVEHNQARYRATRGEVNIMTRHMLALMAHSARSRRWRNTALSDDDDDEESDLPDCNMQ